MASSKDSHLTDIISIVQARPKPPAPVEEPPPAPVEEPPASVEEPPTTSQEEVKETVELPQEPIAEPSVETTVEADSPAEATLPLEVETQPVITVAEEKPVKKRKSRAGRKPLPDKNRRSEILIIRLTKAEKKKLWEQAKKRHTTLSSFVRKVSIGEYDKD